MNFSECIKNNKAVLMEGALGERLKREFGLKFDENIVMAPLVYSEAGRVALKALWGEYADVAAKYNLPFLATTPTRRTNKERIAKTNYDSTIIQKNVELLREVQKSARAEMYVGGLLGFHGDAYTGIGGLSEKESESFHSWEVELFKNAGADFLYAALMPTLPEAAGMALAIEKARVPYIISFTIKADGRLIDGTTITDAIKYIDSITEYKPILYMTNCIHPKIVIDAFSKPFNRNETIRTRFLGIQANTSPLSYEELDGSKDLKTSDPVELAEDIAKLDAKNPLKIFGGCCGTDKRHMEEIAKRICKRK